MNRKRKYVLLTLKVISPVKGSRWQWAVSIIFGILLAIPIGISIKTVSIAAESIEIINNIFLAFVANAGVQVLVETHSDHIINGLRKAVIGQECKIQAKEVGIYYFDKENRAEFLELDADAQFHTWPEDFMEQVEKDLYYIRKMRLANGHRDVVK